MKELASALGLESESSCEEPYGFETVISLLKPQFPYL